MKKVELLAPAGNYEALLGAIAAGADAVYLGGDSFGARAYADNFSAEEIIAGLKYAHLFQRKLYLTVNTLVKEKELASLYDFLLPFYENGLDGVIVQDLGVFRYIREHFPLMELHVSTQMTLTGRYGASYLKEQGAVRVVPARELSLEEIKTIRKETGLEIEAFIHGAMCYCYSGQCLFSSMLGGRSGNRGRCAQPCRLPYSVKNRKEAYPLSMKDMCTLSILPDLVESGIDSFKIEGRMKKPEYAAGVTAIYRKYLDDYYAGRENPAYHYEVSAEDYDRLNKLYIRNSISEGYYFRHNGKEMITLSSPAYRSTEESLLKEIRERYMDQPLTYPVQASCTLKKGKAAKLTLTVNDLSVCVMGETVEKALKQPLAKEQIAKQLTKSGGTFFFIQSLSLDVDEDIFMPVSKLNELRRRAIEELEKELLKKLRPELLKRSARAPQEKEQEKPVLFPKSPKKLQVLVTSKEQLLAARKRQPDRIYIDRFLPDNELKEAIQNTSFAGTECFLASPFILRKKDEAALQALLKELKTGLFQGILVRNLEVLSYLKSCHYSGTIVTDCSIPIWNSEAYQAIKADLTDLTYPPELNGRECRLLQKAAHLPDTTVYPVYGRLPMMISSGCVQKTTDHCLKQSGYLNITDRYGTEFPVYHDCHYCYNIIYNSVPLSLHRQLYEGIDFTNTFRLDFTTETGDECGSILDYFAELSKGVFREPTYQDFTTGHYKRGVE